MHLFEVAIRKFVVRLRLLIVRGVDAQMPLSISLEAVFLNEVILLFGRRLMFAPVIALIENDVRFRDQLPGMFVAASV